MNGCNLPGNSRALSHDSLVTFDSSESTPFCELVQQIRCNLFASFPCLQRIGSRGFSLRLPSPIPYPVQPLTSRYAPLNIRLYESK
jgi:hypothetical protein